jgi:hypothetical protein
MSGSSNDPLPDLFSTEGPPSPAGLATGSESQGPGGGNPAGVDLAANTSPHHTTQGSGSQAEISTVDPQAGNMNPNPQPESLAAGNNGVNMAADTNNSVAGSDGYAANDARTVSSSTWSV